MSGCTKILCVDDNPAVAEAVRCLVQMQHDLQWAGHLENADALVTEALRRTPAIILLDLDMPGRPAFDALRELSERAPGMRVIIVSGFVSQALIDQAFQNGAWGYVDKNDGPQAILEAIRRVQQNECVLDIATRDRDGTPWMP